MSRVFRGIDSIRDVLEASIGNRARIYLSNGRIINIEVENLEDDLLIASVGNRLISININRIDAVVSSCEELFQTIIDRQDDSGNYSRSRYVLREGEIYDYGIGRNTAEVSDPGSIAYESIWHYGTDSIRTSDSREDDYWDSRRLCNPIWNDPVSSNSCCGYIRHEENVERYFY